MRFKAVLPVHLYGQMANMQSILGISRTYSISVVEDAAQAIRAHQIWMAKNIGPDTSAGSEVRFAGTIGDAGTLSFFPSKNLGAAGDAGMVLTDREDLSERIALLRVHGSKPKYVHHLVGYNSRLDEIQAAVLAAKLPHLETWSLAREKNAEYYRQALRRQGIEALCLAPEATPGNRHIYHQFVVRVAKRDALRAFLSGKGIGTEVYYPIPLHLQRCFEHLGYREGDLPETEKAARETLALPVYPELQEEQINYVVESIADFYNRNGR
jgi:dTDP-4-amino-4,6-dideoxygalactose transaminase